MTKAQLLKTIDTLKALRDNSYVSYIGACQKQECCGEEIKMELGVFGHAELNAHQQAFELLGKYRSYSRAVGLLIENDSAPQETTPVKLIPARIIELCERLTSVGSIHENVSASELHEIRDFIFDIAMTNTHQKPQPE